MIVRLKSIPDKKGTVSVVFFSLLDVESMSSSEIRKYSKKYPNFKKFMEKTLKNISS